MADKPYGWYDDPSTSDRFRWWDGAGWTSWVSTSRDAPSPPAPDRRVTPVPTLTDKVIRWTGWALLAGVLIFALIAGIGVALNRRDAPDALPTLPSEPGTIVPLPRNLSLESGVVVLPGVVSVPMPDGDFDRAESDRQRDGLFQQRYFSYLPGSEVPHNAPGAQVHVGIAAGGLMHPQYEGNNAGLAATQIAYQVFGPTRPLVGQPEITEVEIDDRSAWQASVRVTYLDGQTQHEAEVTALVVQLDEWTWLVWAGASTEKMTDQQRAEMAASREGIAFA
ncbi:DUF2510 domain-containing protein [Propionibacteriaceae bacterium Y1923]|uniref:DUF2510 domain-containing protein n=1 Tax=Aestuariimicrobium sp. Y1814 TaxID=3418742 RepID=UPI003C2A2DCF